MKIPRLVQGASFIPLTQPSQCLGVGAFPWLTRRVLICMAVPYLGGHLSPDTKSQVSRSFSLSLGFQVCASTYDHSLWVTVAGISSFLYFSGGVHSYAIPCELQWLASPVSCTFQVPACIPWWSQCVWFSSFLWFAQVCLMFWCAFPSGGTPFPGGVFPASPGGSQCVLSFLCVPRVDFYV